MLAHILALTVGIGSIALYASAFFFPEIHRKNDFILSGLGFFYALVLWIFAPRITGGLLLGHVASVTLLGWFGWQTLSLRRQLTPTAQQTQIPSADAVKTNIKQQVSKLPFQQQVSQLQQLISRTFTGVQDKVKHTTPNAAVSPTTSTQKPTVTVVEQQTPTAEQPIVIPPDTTPISEADTTAVTEETTVIITPPTPPNPPATELVQAAQESAEDKTPHIPVKEVAPDAELAPPAEAPPTQIPPNPPAQSS